MIVDVLEVSIASDATETDMKLSEDDDEIDESEKEEKIR